jgi:hypothetical protein
MASNFYPDEDLTVSGEFGHWASREPITTPHGMLFGHHGFPWHVQGWPVVYCVRDGRAVALSVYRSRNFTNLRWHMDFSEFLQTPLDWASSPGWRDPARAAGTVVEQWYEHVKSWNHVIEAGKAVAVRYEDVVKDQGAQVVRLAEKLGLSLDEPVKLIDKKVGPSPNEARADAWKDQFTGGDLKYFHSVVPNDYKWLTQ